MTTKTTLYVGLNDKDTKRQEITTVQAYKIIENIITTHADGGSIYDGKGIYKHDDGTVVIENSLQVILYDATADAIQKVTTTIKSVLNQESIVKTTENILTEFI